VPSISQHEKFADPDKNFRRESPGGLERKIILTPILLLVKPLLEGGWLFPK